MTDKQFLMKARALIRKGWIQGAFAADRKGKEVPANSRKACRWCTLGSLCSVDGRNFYVRRMPSMAFFGARKALRLAVAEEGFVGHDLVLFNEAPGRKKAEVLKVFAAAIRMCSGSERN